MRVGLVVGGASCVWDDVEAALQLGEYAGVVGANLIGVIWPGRFDAWVSLHPDKLKRPWVERRRRSGLPAHHRVVGLGDTPHRFAGQTEPGSSGLFALKVALDDLGFDRAVLCGVPLAPTAHFNIARPWSAATQYRAGWEQALPHIMSRARSMSGWTADLLGRPPADFFNGV